MAVKSELNVSFGELLHNLLAFQLRVRRLTPAPLFSLSESQVLGEIASGNAQTAKDLSLRCLLEKSTVSRLLAKLAQRKYIEIEGPLEHDLRARRLLITPLGQKELERDDKLRSSVSEELLSPLTQDEKRRFVVFFKKLADGFGLEPSKARPSEHPLRPQQRRLSRAFGLLGGGFFQSNLSILEFHLLSILNISPLRLTAGVLERNLPYSASSLSRALQRLARQKFVARTPISSDKRNLEVLITESGRKRLAAIEEQVKAGLQSACRLVNSIEIEQNLVLLKRITSARDPFKPKLQLKRAATKEELFKARAFLVEELVKNKRHHTLSERILGRGEQVIEAWLENELVAVAGFKKSAGALILTALAFDSSCLSSDGVTEFVRTCAGKLGGKSKLLKSGPKQGGSLLQIQPVL